MNLKRLFGFLPTLTIEYRKVSRRATRPFYTCVSLCMSLTTLIYVYVPWKSIRASPRSTTRAMCAKAVLSTVVVDVHGRHHTRRSHQSWPSLLAVGGLRHVTAQQSVSSRGAHAQGKLLVTACSEDGGDTEVEPQAQGRRGRDGCSRQGACHAPVLLADLLDALRELLVARRWHRDAAPLHLLRVGVLVPERSREPLLDLPHQGAAVARGRADRGVPEDEQGRQHGQGQQEPSCARKEEPHEAHNRHRALQLPVHEREDAPILTERDVDYAPAHEQHMEQASGEQHQPHGSQRMADDANEAPRNDDLRVVGTVTEQIGEQLLAQLWPSCRRRDQPRGESPPRVHMAAAEHRTGSGKLRGSACPLGVRD